MLTTLFKVRQTHSAVNCVSFGEAGKYSKEHKRSPREDARKGQEQNNEMTRLWDKLIGNQFFASLFI